MARPHIELGCGRWHLWRLADDEFVSLAQHALPIDQNFTLLSVLKLHALEAGERCLLGPALTVLERKFGPSSPLFEASCTSFAFPLLLTFERERRVSYLLRCHDHRAELHFPMYRIVPGEPSAQERAISHPPVAGEFSGADMDEFVIGLHRYLLSESKRPVSDLVGAFYRAIPSDLVLYGYDGASFFERSYASIIGFEQARLELEARLGRRRKLRSSDRVERMIDRVTEVPFGGCSIAQGPSAGQLANETRSLGRRSIG